MRHQARFTWVMATLFFVACGQSAPSDDTIAAGVRAGLAADATISASQVEVITKDRIVTLNGSVGTQAIKEQAVRIARQTAGVSDVVDNLQVQAATAPAAGAEPGASGGAPASAASFTPGEAASNLPA